MAESTISGGGLPVSVSLQELTELCAAATGRRVPIEPAPETHSVDLRIYLTDCRKAAARASAGGRRERRSRSSVRFALGSRPTMTNSRRSWARELRREEGSPMKLSIVIPAYNEEKNIGKCLEELQRVVRDEHHIPYEIIVVNDNSQRRHRGRGPRARWRRTRPFASSTARRPEGSAVPCGPAWSTCRATWS